MEGRAQFSYRPSAMLPPLAWLAEVEGDQVRVRCGESVRCTERGFVEGTWVGPPEIASLAHSTTVFGSGIVSDDRGLVVVPPSHPLERIYYRVDQRATIVSNSLVWLLEAAGIALDPAALFPPIFVDGAEGVQRTIIEIPTTDGPVPALVYHNLRLTHDGEPAIEERPHELPFESFADYRQRITSALALAAANAPGYTLLATISSGYDSTAAASVARDIGCRRAVTFTTAKSVGRASPIDSGVGTAERLGMSVEQFDRLAYLARDDLPEAEFLATGMSGEDVVMIAMERSLVRALLVTGVEEFRLKGNPYRPGLYRGDLSSCSLTEFRLRSDFVHVPILFFGATQQPSLIRIMESSEMRPYSVPGTYDKPIQRRLAEDAGIPRGTFATIKRRSSATIHVHGLAAMAPASAAAVREFAAAEGRAAEIGDRFEVRRHHRLLLRGSRALGLQRLTSGLALRRRALIHHEPELGSLLFRWGVSVVAPRYRR